MTMSQTAPTVRRRGRPRADSVRIDAGVLRTPNPVDAHVGSRIRLRRTLLGLSQDTLARSLGIHWAQLRKYEIGSSRVSASRLYQLSQALDVPISFFFDGFHSEPVAGTPDPAELVTPDQLVALPDAETTAMLRVYYSIPQKAVRHRIFELTKALAIGSSVTVAATNAPQQD